MQSLCDGCLRADQDCPIYPVRTRSCVEARLRRDALGDGALLAAAAVRESGGAPAGVLAWRALVSILRQEATA